MRELGLQGDTVTLMVAGGIGIVQFFAVFPVILYIDRFGKRSCYDHSRMLIPIINKGEGRC